VAGTAPAPALAAGGNTSRNRRRGSGDSGLSEFADVEEILKRRGI
jgi:hypothetical protein